jgi:catalase (peroxidase I)
MADKINNNLTKLEKKLIKEENIDELQELVELFNLNLQKKNILRNAKLSDVQDRVVEQILQRIALEPEEFSNDDLIKYHKIIQETLTKTDTTLDNIKVPNIQINQQVNVDKMIFNSESRKRILEAVNDILNGEQTIEADYKLSEESENTDD